MYAIWDILVLKNFIWHPTFHLTTIFSTRTSAILHTDPFSLVLNHRIKRVPGIVCVLKFLSFWDFPQWTIYLHSIVSLLCIHDSFECHSRKNWFIFPAIIISSTTEDNLLKRKYSWKKIQAWVPILTLPVMCPWAGICISLDLGCPQYNNLNILQFHDPK